ncbi:LOW QUALITY PROTEIN: centromere protein S-like [Peromyscus leucopus]|uniref:LOW QUALITY PROTEIN: centromere protein S-like n=1 Tax=Peromyscus leucopus TaxID=10041 RepID=UPI0018857877|nr:LOW QUALITY PROTEIN: centromere protein S-like [Peromyscus leucopus]
MEEEVEAEQEQRFSHRQRLKAAVHYTVGCLCEEVALDKQVQFSKQTVAAISEVTFRQCENFAKDLEMFARHAKRSTVTTEDVKLLARRSNSLLKYITEKNEEIAQLNLERKAKKKRKPEDENRNSREPDAEVEAAEGKRNGLLTFLAWWHGWTSQASSSALLGGDASEVSKWQESPPLQQPPRRDKKPCKNFFWKTFSSCK